MRWSIQQMADYPGLDVDRPYPFQTEDVFIYSGSGNSYNTFVTGYEGSLIRFQRWSNYVADIPTYTGKSTV